MPPIDPFNGPGVLQALGKSEPFVSLWRVSPGSVEPLMCQGGPRSEGRSDRDVSGRGLVAHRYAALNLCSLGRFLSRPALRRVSFMPYERHPGSSSLRQRIADGRKVLSKRGEGRVQPGLAAAPESRADIALYLRGGVGPLALGADNGAGQGANVVHFIYFVARLSYLCLGSTSSHSLHSCERATVSIRFHLDMVPSVLHKLSLVGALGSRRLGTLSISL